MSNPPQHGGAQAGTARLLEFASLVPELATAAMLVGLTTTSVLFCSHFHQVEGDIAAGKMSPLVRLGTRGGYEVGVKANSMCSLQELD